MEDPASTIPSPHELPLVTAPRLGGARPRHARLGTGNLARLLTGARVVDVRDPGEYFGSGGHLPRSRLVPLPDLPLLCQGWDPDERVLLVCDDGSRSSRAAEVLRQRGFRDVEVLPGGLDAWAEVGLRLSDRARLTEGTLVWSL